MEIIKTNMIHILYFVVQVREICYKNVCQLDQKETTHLLKAASWDLILIC